MSPYSTMSITREDALGEIMKNILKATDEQVANVLFDLVGESNLLNFTIVNEYNDGDYLSYHNNARF